MKFATHMNYDVFLKILSYFMINKIIINDIHIQWCYSNLDTKCLCKECYSNPDTKCLCNNFIHMLFLLFH